MSRGSATSSGCNDSKEQIVATAMSETGIEMPPGLAMQLDGDIHRFDPADRLMAADETRWFGGDTFVLSTEVINQPDNDSEYPGRNQVAQMRPTNRRPA